jgi:hypothetical protein
MSFEFKKYINYINNREFDEANKYRLNNSPKFLIKYIGLYDNKLCSRNSSVVCSNNSEKNESQLYALENNMLWMPTFDNLNDPFEFKAVYIDKGLAKKYGWKTSELKEMLDIMKKMHLVAAFSTNLSESMPMWAHYANNHKGFCIKYKVEDPKLLYPVSYESERMALSSTIMELLNDCSYFNKMEGLEYVDDKLCFNILYHLAVIKHKSWQYESEYRMIYSNLKNIKNGQLVCIDELGIKVDSIYIGTSCSKENRERLIDIARKLKYDVNEMYLDEFNPLFELSWRRV